MCPATGSSCGPRLAGGDGLARELTREEKRAIRALVTNIIFSKGLSVNLICQPPLRPRPPHPRAGRHRPRPRSRPARHSHPAPRGNLVTRDLLYDEHTNKQFITVQTSGGNTFYIVIDYDKPVDEEGEQYETYF